MTRVKHDYRPPRSKLRQQAPLAFRHDVIR
jgi:hypothetical protein